MTVWLSLSVDLPLSVHVEYMRTHVLYVLLVLLYVHVYTQGQAATGLL